MFYLSFAYACFSITTAPRLIVDALSQEKTISYNKCMTQIFATHFFGCMEIFGLILMAFDRYIAICKPLQYTAIMSQHLCGVLVILAWVESCIHSSAQIFLALRLPFCGPNVIDQYFCDLQPLLKLACIDISVINLLVVSNSGAIHKVGFMQKEGEKSFLHAPPTSLWLSYFLVHVYSYSYAHQPHFQETRWWLYFIQLGHPYLIH